MFGRTEDRGAEKKTLGELLILLWIWMIKTKS